MGDHSSGATTDYLTGPDNARNDEAESYGQLIRSKQLGRAERRNRVLKLRRDGFTYDQISLALAQGADGKEPFEMSPAGCRGAVNAYLADLQGEDRETVADLRLIDNERLERMFQRLELDARSTDPKVREKAIGQQIRILERHARLNGLDAPQVHRHEGKVAIEALANPDHVAKIDQEFRERFGSADYELPAGDVVEEGVAT